MSQPGREAVRRTLEATRAIRSDVRAPGRAGRGALGWG